jgi:hypothetical protein
LLNKVGYLTPGYDQTDPDLIPEALKRPRVIKAKAKVEKPEEHIREALGKMGNADGS